MNCRHTRVPCYSGNIDNIEGLLHLRRHLLRLGGAMSVLGVGAPFAHVWLKDVVSHEFFHTLTPLTIHSQEIQNFDYNAQKCLNIYGCMKVLPNISQTFSK